MAARSIARIADLVRTEGDPANADDHSALREVLVGRFLSDHYFLRDESSRSTAPLRRALRLLSAHMAAEHCLEQHAEAVADTLLEAGFPDLLLPPHLVASAPGCPVGEAACPA